MKPQSVYFTVDLSQRPPAESKRGVLVRAFEMAARQAIDDAMGEGSLPGVVLVMVTLAPRPVLPEEPKPDACCPGATGLPCSTPEPGRLMPDFCIPAAGIATKTWTISLPFYGAFLFYGSEAEAEEMRAHKANREGEIARKRLATAQEVSCNEPILQKGDCGYEWKTTCIECRRPHEKCQCSRG